MIGLLGSIRPPKVLKSAHPGVPGRGDGRKNKRARGIDIPALTILTDIVSITHRSTGVDGTMFR